MNLENFADYLKYPSRLYQLPYEELKSLTLQYPYCGNFHVLLLIKSKLEGHPDLEKNLAKAATYSVDRRFLRQIMQDNVLLRPETHFTIGEDEVLELKDLFTLDSELETIPLDLSEHAAGEEFSAALRNNFRDKPAGEELQFPAGPSVEGDLPEVDFVFDNPAGSFSETELPEPEIPVIIPEDSADNAGSGIPDAAAGAGVFLPEPALIADLAAVIGITEKQQTSQRAPDVVAAPPLPPFELPQAVLLTAAAAGRAVDHWWALQEQVDAHTVEWEIPVPAPRHKEPEKTHLPPGGQKIRIAPTPKSRFKSYRKTYQPPLEVKPSARAEPDAGLYMPAREVAKDSVREDLEIASETLAGLLVQQHQYDRAIKMYEHLSLLIPEKNTYFAAKIDEIKNL